MTHKITVVFTVEAEQVGPWSPGQVALNHIKHVIDEGYTFEGTWEIVPDAYEAFPTVEKVKQADPESYPQTRKGKGPVQPQGEDL